MGAIKEQMAKPGTRRFARFALVGFASLGVEYAMLMLFVELAGMDYLPATTASFAAGVLVNYVLSVRYVFDHREGMSRKREFTIFAVLSAVGLGLNDLYMFVGVGLFNVGYQGMKLLSTFFVTWYNYFSRKRFLGAR